MKKILSIAALSMLSLSSLLTAPAQAATQTGTFLVNVSLTSSCQVGTASKALDFGTYTAFGSATVPTPDTSISFNCTNGLSPSGVALDAAGPTVVGGLAYTLSVGTMSRAAGSAGTTTTAATADVLTYVVTGGMIDGQAGTGSGAASVTRILTVTY